MHPLPCNPLSEKFPLLNNISVIEAGFVVTISNLMLIKV